MKKRILFLGVLIIMVLSSMLCGCQTKQGEIYTLQQAYDNGFITQEDLLSIAYYHHSSTLNDGREFNTELMGEDYQPAEISPESLDKITVRSIKKTLKTDVKNANSSKAFKPRYLHLNGYYGTYNGCVAITMSYSTGGGIDMEFVCYEVIIGGVTFYYSAYAAFATTANYEFDNEILIWKEI